MNKTVFLLFSVVALLLFSVTPQAAPASGAQNDELARAPRISLSEFKALLAHGNVLVLDVRDVQSYRNGHIPGATSLPLAELTSRAPQLRSEKRPIVTYCA